MSNPFEVPGIRKEIAPKATSGFRSLLEKAMTPLSLPPAVTSTATIPTVTRNDNDADDAVPNTNTLPPYAQSNGGRDDAQFEVPQHRLLKEQDDHLYHQIPLPLQLPPPMIDYWRFKKRLKFFARRRCHILRILQKRRQNNNNSHHADGTTATISMNNAYEDQAIQEFLQPNIAALQRPLRTTILGCKNSCMA